MNIATRNTLMLLSDHIGKLTYSMPDSGFVHEINDVGVTVEKDGRERISAKIYKRTDDMTEISIWEYGDYDPELIQEFKERHKNELVDFSYEHGELPSVIDEIIAATDETADFIGRYYEAFVVIEGKMYNMVSHGYVGDCFLINHKVAFAQTSDELVYDMEAREEAVQEIKDN